MPDGIFVGEGGEHPVEVPGPGRHDVAQVPEQGHVAHFAAGDEGLPGLLGVAAGREPGLPGLGRLQPVLDQPLPQVRLRLIPGRRVAQQRDVPHLHAPAGAFVLGKRVFVEPGKGVAQALAQGVGDGLPEGGEVERRQLRYVVAPEHDAVDGPAGIRLALRFMGQVRRQHVRHRAHVELPAGKHGEAGHEVRVLPDHAPDRLLHPAAVVPVEFPFVEEGGQHLGHQPAPVLHGEGRQALHIELAAVGSVVEFAHVRALPVSAAGPVESQNTEKSCARNLVKLTMRGIAPLFSRAASAPPPYGKRIRSAGEMTVLFLLSYPAPRMVAGTGFGPAAAGLSDEVSPACNAALRLP